MKRLIRNGFLSGLVGGLAMAVFSLLFARGPMNAALDFEEQTAHDAGAHSHDELFSRGVQEIGGALGIILFGVALGVIFAIVLGAVAPSLGAVSPMRAALQLGLVGFGVVVVVPFLKYPPNPPAVGDPDTVNERTIAYFALLGASILLAFGVRAALEWVSARTKLSSVGRAWFGFGLFFVAIAALFLILPAPADAVTAPTDLVWNFRLAALGGLAAAWTAMALTMGTLLHWDAAAAIQDRVDLTEEAPGSTLEGRTAS